jgi:tetratricopeptide (TPR) repeat protein
MPVRIFLSAVSDEFLDYRDQIRHDLTRHNVEVKVQEDFKDLGTVTLDKLDLYITNCDAVVHLIGNMTGAAAKPESTKSILAKYPDLPDRLPPLRQPLADSLAISYTQWEAWLALYHGKLLVIAKADDAARRGPKYAPTNDSRASQQEHLTRLSAVERYPGGAPFTSSDDLAKQILSGAILDMLAVADNRRIKIRTAIAAVVLVLSMLAGYLAWDRHLRNAEMATTLDQLARERLSTATLEEIEAVVRKKSSDLTAAQIDRFIQSLRDLKGDPSFARAVEAARNGNTRVAEGIWLQIYENGQKEQQAARQKQAEAARNLAASAIVNSVAEGLKWYREATSLDPSNMEGWIGLGDAATSAGTLREADAAFLKYIELARRTNDEREISVGLERHGDVLKAQGNLPEALKAFRDGLAISDRLAKADPGNAGWQRDLSVSYDRVGDVLKAQGNLPEALKSFRDGLAISDRLAKADPGNASWQRDLSVSYNKIGDVLVAQGNLPEALNSFRDGLAIRDRLAKADPGNAGWQRDLSVSYSKLADAFRKAGDGAMALDALRQGRAIMVRMTSLSPDNAVWKRDLAWFDGQIAELAR